MIESLAIALAAYVCLRTAQADARVRAAAAAQAAAGNLLIGRQMWIRTRDAQGRRLGGAIPPDTRHIAIFVIHGSSYGADAAYWRAIVAAGPGPGHVWYLGYCDGARCNQETLAEGNPGFSLAGYGEVLGLQLAHKADARGELLLLDTRGIVEAAYPWRGRPRQETLNFLGRQR